MSGNIFLKHFKKIKCIILLAFYTVGVTIFITGFIPKSIVKLPASTSNSTLKTCLKISGNQDFCKNIHSDSFHTRHYRKLIVVVIDALRADFIPSVIFNQEFNTSLPFTEKLINEHNALPLIGKVHSPTVTMPRIKSLTTGGVSTFMDFLTNLNAVTLNEDNFLFQATQQNLKSVFYGDETWLKLFPDTFMRSEGTHSFFVSDFKEVDFNVTRHLALEFSAKKDWDIMILHYLGVDHIGHAFGPHSQYLAPKLIELDNVIKLMYQKLTVAQSESLIFICGDHGMTSAGSHGGVSKGEIFTPFIFIKTKKSHHIKESKLKIVDQVDFVATISILMGTPIPRNNFGVIIPSVLHYSGLSTQQIIKAALQNLLQLFEVHKSVFPYKHDLYVDLIRDIIKEHSKYLDLDKIESSTKTYELLLKSYTNLLEDMKNDLITSTAGYSENHIVLGFILMWLMLIFLTTSLIGMQNNPNVKGYFFKPVFFSYINVLTLPLHIVLFALYFSLMINLILFFSTCLVLSLFNLVIRVSKYYMKILHFSSLGNLYFFLLILHFISLFSSSYIEEEHQVWYFSVTSILILSSVQSACSTISYSFKLEAKNHKITPLCSWNILSIHKNSDTTCFLVVLLMLHRILRSWNQTGNKWQHLPDISDWLNKEENSFYLSFFVIVSQIFILLYLKSKQKQFTYHCMCLGLMLTYLYKCYNEYLSSILEQLNINPNVIPWTLYSIIFIILFTSKNIISFITSWLLLSELIGRMHNIPLLAATLLQEHLLNKVLNNSPNYILFNTSYYLQMALCSFYYQGNSNSLSTIDVFSGYVGMSSYKPVIAGILITCNTYSLLILWLTLLIYRNYTYSIEKSLEQKIIPCFIAMLIYRLSVLSVYCIVLYIMKHHLFIFSVFAPKLFYELCHSILFASFTFIIILVSILKSKNL